MAEHRKKLFLLFHGRFPSEKAAALFAAKSAEAFAGQGLSVVLLVPRRKGVVARDAFAYYGIPQHFTIVELPTIDIFGGPFKKLAFWASYGAFSFSAAHYIRNHQHAGDIVYSNETLPLYAASLYNANTFYEMHDFPESKLRLFGLFLRRMKWLLVHNNWKIEQLKKRYRDISKRILYEPNAVDVSAFDSPLSARQARAKLNLPQEKKIAVYTGHLYGWKGVDTLAGAARLLPENFLVAFIGGTREDVEKFKTKHGGIKNILIAGHRPHQEMPVWQKAADVLVLPNTATEDISKYYTSPMKLFEYMASKKPIVASRIPSILEITGEDKVLFVEPDNAKALAEKIREACEENDQHRAMIGRAYQYVLDHTWKKRAHRILKFIKHHE